MLHVAMASKAAKWSIFQYHIGNVNQAERSDGSFYNISEMQGAEENAFPVQNANEGLNRMTQGVRFTFGYSFRNQLPDRFPSER